MRIVGEANAYVSKTEPFKLKGDDERERLSTVLHTLAQAVSDINTLISPFLPHAANRVHAVLGGDGEFMPMPRLEVVDDLDDDARSYPVITGDYSGHAALGARPVVVGHADRQADRRSSSSSTPSRSSRTSAPGWAIRSGRHRHHTDPLADPKMAGRASGDRRDGQRTDDAPA